ncbi:hypothetical protein GCM10028783_22780 [Modestobacter muralis]
MRPGLVDAAGADPHRPVVRRTLTDAPGALERQDETPDRVSSAACGARSGRSTASSGDVRRPGARDGGGQAMQLVSSAVRSLVA